MMKELEGFKKVAEEGGTFVVGTFWNPVTKEIKTVRERDYDYADGSRDNDELYYMPIDRKARIDYLHYLGVVLVGDTVEVYKGRKIPKGTIGVIKEIYDWRDRYGRAQTRYAVFEDGSRTSVGNCRLISPA